MPIRKQIELMHYGVGQNMSRVGVIMANQADNLLVGRWLGAVRLGEYSRADQLMSVPTGLLGDVLDMVCRTTHADWPRRSSRALRSSHLSPCR